MSGVCSMSAYTIRICECNYYEVTVHAESEEGAREEYELGLAYPNNNLETFNENGTSMIVDVSKEVKK
jgi:hypothetical protein